jgi:Putative zinc-finger
MCDRSEKLIAWLDRELPEQEAVAIERHVHDCADCRNCLDAYSKVGQAFDAYCEQMMVESPRRKFSRWVPVLSGLAAAALLLTIFHPRRLEPPPLRAQTPIAPVVLKTVPQPIAPVSTPTRTWLARQHVVAPAQTAATPSNWMPPDATIQIAIPAEAMFAPGAIPEGVNLTADLSIGADGSAEDLRLRP